jgi:hypothetical protein
VVVGGSGTLAATEAGGGLRNLGWHVIAPLEDR